MEVVSCEERFLGRRCTAVAEPGPLHGGRTGYGGVFCGLPPLTTGCGAARIIRGMTGGGWWAGSRVAAGESCFR